MQQIRRIDKWLWEVRVFKTRNQASVACRAGKVRMENKVVKPSKELRPGDLITIHNLPVTKTLRVVDFPDSRVGAKWVCEFMEDLTPVEEYNKLTRIRELNFEYREQGAGRPTKRQRRDIETLKKRWKE